MAIFSIYNIFSFLLFKIPTASLSQGLSRGPLTSEVAVVVKSKSRGTQGTVFFVICLKAKKSV